MTDTSAREGQLSSFATLSGPPACKGEGGVIFATQGPQSQAGAPRLPHQTKQSVKPNLEEWPYEMPWSDTFEATPPAFPSRGSR